MFGYQEQLCEKDPDLAMVEHSMCQPGLPCPQGEFQAGSWGLEDFHKAKSRVSRLSPSPGEQSHLSLFEMFKDSETQALIVL